MSVIETASEEMRERVIDRFWETVPPMWNRIRGHIRVTAMQYFDLTVEQFHILRHIRKGLHSASELAEVKQISRPAISQAVDILVEKGLITRQHSQEDRRYIRLDLTREGNDLLSAIFKKNRDWMLQKLTPLTQGDIDHILIAMELLNKVFDESENQPIIKNE